MKKILIDTNVILDIALGRRAFVEKSVELLRQIVKCNLEAFVTATTITDIYSITQKETGHKQTIEFLKNLTKFIRIAGVDTVSITNALNSGMEDFEDDVQTETAKTHDIKVLITRNKNDFADSGLTVYSPGEYLALQGINNHLDESKPHLVQ